MMTRTYSDRNGRDLNVNTNGIKLPQGRIRREAAGLQPYQWGVDLLQDDVLAFEWAIGIGLPVSEPEKTLIRTSDAQSSVENRVRTMTMKKLIICCGYPSISRMKGYATDGGGAIITITCV
jgi:hypothetical protein